MKWWHHHGNGRVWGVRCDVYHIEVDHTSILYYDVYNVFQHLLLWYWVIRVHPNLLWPWALRHACWSWTHTWSIQDLGARYILGQVKVEGVQIILYSYYIIIMSYIYMLCVLAPSTVSSGHKDAAPYHTITLQGVGWEEGGTTRQLSSRMNRWW